MCEVTSDFARFDDKENMEKFKMPKTNHTELYTPVTEFQYKGKTVSFSFTYTYEDDFDWWCYAEFRVNDKLVPLGDYMSDDDKVKYYDALADRFGPHIVQHMPFDTEVNEIIAAALDFYISKSHLSMH